MNVLKVGDIAPDFSCKNQRNEGCKRIFIRKTREHQN